LGKQKSASSAVSNGRWFVKGIIPERKKSNHEIHETHENRFLFVYFVCFVVDKKRLPLVNCIISPETGNLKPETEDWRPEINKAESRNNKTKPET